MANPRGKCIFSGEFGVTKEHLFADWLRELFPRTASDTHTFGRRDWAIQTAFDQRVHQGHSGSRKVRKVCARCNNGWISVIDDAARRAITPLIQGTPTLVTQAMQRAIAAWFAKISMVGDSLHPAKSVVLQADRTWMMNRNLPPANWEVWIGTYGGTVWRELGIWQHSGNLMLPLMRDGQRLSGYTMATSLGLGSVFGLVLGTSIERIGFDLGSAASFMTRIWPTCCAFSWPLDHVLSDGEATAVANILTTMTVNPLNIQR
jgi:hypothetical protein